jgi:WD40 repeat protein
MLHSVQACTRTPSPGAKLALARECRRLVTAQNGENVHLWSIEDDGLKELSVLKGSGTSLQTVAISSDGNRVMFVQDFVVINVWDVEAQKVVQKLTGHTGNHITSLAFSPDGYRAVSTTMQGNALVHDKAARVWNLETGKQVGEFNGHALRGAHTVTRAQFLPDGKKTLSTGGDGHMRLWDAERGAELRPFQANNDVLEGLAVSPDGKRAVTCGRDRAIRVWNVETGKELRRITDAYFTTDLAISPDGTLLAAFAPGVNFISPELRFWELETGKERGKFTGDEHYASGLAFVDWRTITGVGKDGVLRVWQIEERPGR